MWTNKKKMEQILGFDGVGAISADLVSIETIDKDLETIGKCFKRFLNYDFGNLDPAQVKENNKGLLMDSDIFGCYETDKGRLSILKLAEGYRIVFEKGQENDNK